jgi:hypothetical protein
LTPPFTSVAYCARSESRYFHLALARRIKARFKGEIHLYCIGPQEVEFYQKENSDGVFTSIISDEFSLSSTFPADASEDLIYARAQENERKYGCTYNFLTVNNRHFGRGYMLGGFYHPRSRQSELPYAHMVHSYNNAFEFWETEFERKGISLCLNGGEFAAKISATLGVPFRTMAGSRLDNLHYWAWNKYYESPEIEKAFDRLTAPSEVSLDKPYYAHLAGRGRYKKSFGFIKTIHSMVMTTARYFYWNIRGYAKAKGYYYSEHMRLHYRTWREYRRLSKLASAKLSDLGDKPFVFYPMHVEPETALQGLSPEFFFQHAAIAALSRDLPVGVTLAVKEAYGAIGRRPANFYDQVAELKNVVFLDTWEIGLECVIKSVAVATICGSAGFEGAAHGKPVVAFGAHNIYNFLPHVLVVGRDGELPELVRRATSGTGNKIDRMKAGMRMLAAVKDISFDMKSFDYVDQNGFEDESLEAALECLVRSVPQSDFEAVERAT